MNNLNVIRGNNNIKFMPRVIAFFLCYQSIALMIFTSTLVGFFFITLELTKAGTFPGANGKIVFQSDRDGNYEIYVMEPDGSAQTNLTNNTAGDFKPAWSQDGSKIVFQSNRSGNLSIYVMNADGGGITQLTSGNPNGDFDPTWSSDGTKIAFARGVSYGKSEIYVMNADGSNLTNLTNNGMLNNAPTWSPKGNKIAFTRASGLGSDSEIYVMNTDGSAQTNLTNYPGLLESYATWSPDGNKIAFSRYGYGNASDIYTMNADGNNQTNITNSTAADDAVPAWSPDGNKIAFLSNKFDLTNGDIYVMNTDGGAIARLTSNAANDSGPDWQSSSIQASFDLKPDTLNLKSDGKFVTVYIELPQGNDVNDIDVNSVRLQETIDAKSSPSNIGDYDNDGNPDLMLKFDRKSLEEKLAVNNSVNIKITGKLQNGTSFEGEDTLRVIKPG